jgi:hypothetical protein
MPGNPLLGFYIELPLPEIYVLEFRPRRMNARKTIRLLAVSLALLALLIFATGVVSDWNHQSPSDDANCPYCHLGHQAPAQFVVAPSVLSLKPIASLPLPEDKIPVVVPVFSQTAPRAPPV